jgi:lipoic acid synthetase
MLVSRHRYADDLGDICTRSCNFCAVKTGRPTELDLDEPARVAEAQNEQDGP